jgi:ABC-type multidrug transport system fused ATPase/permease subunit
VLNNLVEAKVSVDRVQGFLLESEKKPVTAYPLKKTGALMQKATLVWESGVKRKVEAAETLRAPKESILQRGLNSAKELGGKVLVTITCGRLGASPPPGGAANSQVSPTTNPMLSRTNSGVSLTNSGASLTSTGGNGSKPAAAKPTAAPPLSEDELLSIVREAQVIEAEKTILDLEAELAQYRSAASAGLSNDADAGADSPLLRASSFIDGDEPAGDMRASVDFRESSSSPVPGGAGKDARILTLSRISLQAREGQLISVVGPVGSGKSSLLSALLGDMR